jgi:hypothetical protein
VGTGDAAYGLINRGSITGSGVYAGVEARALQLGVDGGQAVTVAGGVRNEGTISASASKADASAIWIGADVSAPTLYNSGTIQTGVSGNTANTSTAVLIGAGANLPSMTNVGVITAAFTGNHGDAVAVRDASGTLTQFTNAGTIAVGITPDTTDDTPLDGEAIAIDLSANTTGVTLRQYGIVASSDSTATDSDDDGVPDNAEPAIIGDIRLGSGDDALNVENGTIIGDISFGGGADALNISGGAAVSGAITNAAGLSVNVANGSLFANQTTATDIASLNVGADGTLVVTVDPAANTGGGFNVSGAANIATGAALGVRFASLLQEPARFDVINADSLTVGTIDQTLLGENSPYLYVVEAGADTAAGQVYIDARRRTAQEADLIPVEASAFDAVYAALGDNQTLQNLFLSQTNRDDFIDVYEQMLPDHSGGPLMSLAAGVDAVTRALTGRNAAAAPVKPAPGSRRSTSTPTRTRPTPTASAPKASASRAASKRAPASAPSASPPPSPRPTSRIPRPRPKRSCPPTCWSWASTGAPRVSTGRPGPVRLAATPPSAPIVRWSPRRLSEQQVRLARLDGGGRRRRLL